MSRPFKFEIIDKLGQGQFSTVYRAKWIDPPPELENGGDNNYQQLANGAEEPEQNRQKFKAPFPPVEIRKVCPSQRQKKDGDGCPLPRARRERLVALKRIELCDFQNSQARTDYYKEVCLLQQVKHPNIINFNISFYERNELFIVLELADGGDLSKLIKYFQRKERLIPEQTILKYFTQVASAVEYIHSKRILHRDIKPANIFMTSDGCVKLGDFGLGRFFSQNTRDAHSIVGTFYYMSPERIRESGYSFSSDVWSLGCVLYELITLNSPFSILNQQKQPALAYNGACQNVALNQQVPQTQAQQSNQQYNIQWLFDRITRAEYPSLDCYKHISFTLRELTVQCLDPNPDARPDMGYICSVVCEAFRLAGERAQLQTRTGPNLAWPAAPSPLGPSTPPIQQQQRPPSHQRHAPFLQPTRPPPMQSGLMTSQVTHHHQAFSHYPTEIFENNCKS